MAKAPSVLILNGPNLNLLGKREPETYGRTTLGEIEARCQERAGQLGLKLECRQSNSEGELIDLIQAAAGRHGGIVMNPGAYTHTSIAILDALQAVALPVIEVHLSNIHKRESFRGHSYVSRVALGVICGFGAMGYIMALEAMAGLLIEQQET
ncbi:MAG: type II 3-dehydroquinate dehydratase [Rhodospirillales bacterium]|nr:type II 3-dehydroquinate dehydratase [Rhodospirillales bacterium]